MGAVEQIIERVAAVLGAPDGPPVALDGGITNRNFRIRLGGTDYVLRLPGKDTTLLGISRDAERIAGEAAARLGIGPSVAFADETCLVTAYVAGRPATPQQLQSAPEVPARALLRFHRSRIELPTRFWVPELLDAYAGVVLARDRPLPLAYGHARRLARRIADALPLSEPVPCHNDLLPANVLEDDADGRLVLVDWEYAGMGHALFDLGNLAVNNEFEAVAEDRLLTAYFGEPPTDGRRAALRLMRVMSDIREAAWGVVQGTVSEIDFDFDAYAARHFERMAAAADQPAFGEWIDAATA